MEKSEEDKKCKKCGHCFSKKFNLIKHVRTFHPDQIDELVSFRKKVKGEYQCKKCEICFSTRYNLRKHVRTFHPDQVNELAPNYRISSNFKFTCEICGRNYNHQKNYRAHMRTHTPNKEATSKSKKCPLCEYQTPTIQDIHDHFTKNHDITLITENLLFSTFNEFTNWKNEMEIETNTRFVKNSAPKGKSMYVSYDCHRSGTYNPKGKGLRRLKRKGTNKINAYCPSKMTVVLTEDKFKVSFIKTHVGHENELKRLNLSESERKFLAEKVASNVPFDTILSEISGSLTDNNLRRLHLLSRKDLHNIKKCFKISVPADREHVTGDDEDADNATTDEENATSDSENVREDTENDRVDVENAENTTQEVVLVDNEAPVDNDQVIIFQIYNEDSADDNNFNICSTTDDETANIPEPDNHYLIEDEKRKILQNFQRELDKIESFAELNVVKKIVDSLPAALANNTATTAPKRSNVKISAQKILKEQQNKTVVLVNNTFYQSA